MGEPVNHPETKWTGEASNTAIDRILDANFDRAREGLRIIEEWCRFGLNSESFTGECKHLRQELAQWHTADIRAARDTPGDPGTELTHPQEQQRANLTHVLQANFCRVQEALRVLEEYGKLSYPAMSAVAKTMRYQVYTLESRLLGHQRQLKLQRSLLYLVTTPTESILETVEAALQGGVTLVQYRDKDADDLTRLQWGQKLRALCQRYDALFIVNDRVDLALALEADGVHLGQQDIPIALARQILGHNRIVGRSTHCPEDLHRAQEEGADYIGVGPVYETPTKPGRSAAGLDYVRYAADHATIPWFAIGSIDPDNLNEVLSANAERVAVVRAIMHADNPTLITQYFISQLGRMQMLKAIGS
jgi:thiamine-phosphate pyrophosphorylase